MAPISMTYSEFERHFSCWKYTQKYSTYFRRISWNMFIHELENVRGYYFNYHVETEMT